MLVLTRRQGEWVDIGQGISVCVCRIGPDTVRLGFEAPKDVVINRREITASIKREQNRKKDNEDAQE